MKKRLIFKNLIAIILVSSTAFLTSCIKDRNLGAVDFSQLKPIAQIIGSGISNFGSESMLLDPTATSDNSYSFLLNYAATNVAPVDITFTLGYDAAALAAYNAANPTTPYVKYPDSIYSFTTTTVVIKAGQSYSLPVGITMYPNKIDPSVSYMLPISITAVSPSTNISGNFGTMYYHIIGNPLAGTYNDVGTRYNYSGTVAYAGPVGNNANIPAGYTGTTALNNPKMASPISAQTITMSFSNLGFGSGYEYGYLITGNTGFSAITLGWNAAFTGGNSSINGFIISYVPPSPTQKPAFHVVTHYNNAAGGGGNDRIIDESFTHQ